MATIALADRLKGEKTGEITTYLHLQLHEGAVIKEQSDILMNVYFLAESWMRRSLSKRPTASWLSLG